jgi:hypothetical protein
VTTSLNTSPKAGQARRNWMPQNDFQNDCADA